MTDIIRRGRGNPPEPMQGGADYPLLKNCPDCDGRGWFLINPFATGGSNGAGGIGNMTACLTCIDSKAYYDKHYALPPEIVLAIYEAEEKKRGKK